MMAMWKPQVKKASDSRRYERSWKAVFSSGRSRGGVLSDCPASALRSSNSTGIRHSMGRHRAMMAPHRPKLSSTPRSTSASRILPRPLLALMMPDTAEAFFSPSSGVIAPMIRPKEKAPSPAAFWRRRRS